MGSSPISGTWLLSALLARVFEPHIGNSGTSTHLLFFLCASFCQTASPRSGASDFARPRSSVASSSPPPRAACISGTPAVFACTVPPMCLLRCSLAPWVLAASSPMSGAPRRAGALRARGRAVSRSLVALPTFPGKPHPRVRKCTPLSVGTVVLGGCRW